MCEEAAGAARINKRRSERLQHLCSQLGLDAILLISGWDGCYSLECKGLVEWLTDVAGAAGGSGRAAALEEGLFVATPNELVWFVETDLDGGGDAAPEGAGSVLEQLLGGPAGAAAGDGGSGSTPQPMDMDVDATAAAPSPPPAAAAAAGGAPQQQAQPVDGKLSLLLQLHPRLKRVGLALGVEVRGGVQQQVPQGSLWRWPLLMALAEQLQLPMEQLFQEVVDITPHMRTLLGGVDGALLHNTLCLRRPLLTRAWLEALGTCGRRTAAPKLGLTEASIAAAVSEFVSGCGCRLKPGQYQPLALPPRVLLGERTSHQEALSSGSVSLRSQAAVQGMAVLHATLEAADACSPLRVARTIFFGQGAAAADTPLQLLLQGTARPAQSPAAAAAAAGSSVDEAVCRCNSGAANNAAGGDCAAGAAGGSSSSGQQLPLGRALLDGDYEVDHVDLFDLMGWYWAAVDAAWQTMEVFATQEGATWPAVRAHGTRVFWQSAAAAQLVPARQDQQQQPQGQQQQLPELSLQLFSWDGGPRPMPCTLHLEQHNARVKTLRVVVSGITSRSPSHPGRRLGSVLYMDTFVDVPAVHGCPAQLINLTLTHCPTYSFNFWGSEASHSTQLLTTFRRHLQLQLQMQAQAAAEAQAQAALRKSVPDDGSMLRMQLQQELRGGAAAAAAAAGSISPVGVSKAGGTQRRSSLGQQQQLLLLQQLAAAGSGGASNSSDKASQQLLLQLQQHQLQQQQPSKQAAKTKQKQKQQGKAGKAASGSSSGGNTPQQQQQQQQQQEGSSDKPSLARAMSCCEEQCPEDDGSEVKRSCCGGSELMTASPPAAAFHLDVSTEPTAATAAAGKGGAGSSKAAAAGGAGSSAAGAAAGTAGRSSALDGRLVLQLRQLGRLLVPPGEMPGEVALLFTGAVKLAVMDGPLYPHTNGFVFVSRPTKVHVVTLEQIEAVWLQDFASQMPGHPDLGPCVVIKGRRPCCGLLPAMHMTDNVHVALPLRALTKACSQHWVTVVLPAWNAAASLVKASKGASAPWPLPTMLQPFWSYWASGPRKRYMVPIPDAALDAVIQALDQPSAAREQQQQH